MHVGMQKQPYRPRRTSWTGITLSLATGIALLLLISFFLFEPYSTDIRVSHSYSVDIDASDGDSYEVLCPVPTYDGMRIRKDIEKEIRVTKGEAEISIVETKYGTALSIRGHGPVNISWEDHWSGTGSKDLVHLTMSTYQGDLRSMQSWLYCDCEGVSFHLGSQSKLLIWDGLPRGHSVSRTIDGVLTSVGWQILPMEVDHFSFI